MDEEGYLGTHEHISPNNRNTRHRGRRSHLGSHSQRHKLRVWPRTSTSSPSLTRLVILMRRLCRFIPRSSFRGSQGNRARSVCSAWRPHRYSARPQHYAHVPMLKLEKYILLKYSLYTRTCVIFCFYLSEHSNGLR